MNQTTLLIKMGCKKWSNDNQLGLRIYTLSINQLMPVLNMPSHGRVWKNLSEFIQRIKQNTRVRPPPYSKEIMVVSKGKQNILATMTIAKHGRSSQGYITAPKNTWFYDFVNNHLSKNIEFEYISSSKDMLVIPRTSRGIAIELKTDRKEIKKRVSDYCKKQNLVPPPNAKEIGLFYEIEEKRYLERSGFIAKHRYPYITTSDPSLRDREVSCDIDVFDKNNKFIKFVEVKSISSAPGTEFNLTINEFESRKKCVQKNWPYEIVIYYHFGNEVIERKVIKISDRLHFSPSGYLCSQ